MEIILAAVVAAAASYWYFSGRPGLPAAAGASSATPYRTRNQGPIIGTVPPGVTLPGQSVEGPGPNTTGAIVAGGYGVANGFAQIMSSNSGSDGSDSGSGSMLGGALAIGGAIIGIGLSLWQAHAARVKGAKDENAVLNELVPNFSKALIAEFNALNAGQVSPTTALNDLEGIRVVYWNAIAPYQRGPGQHTHPCSPLRQDDPLHTGEYAPGCIPWNSPTMQTTPCDASCTAGCCIGCDYVEPAICAAKYLIQNPSVGSIKVHAVGASKYGYAGQPGFTLTYTPRY